MKTKKTIIFSIHGRMICGSAEVEERIFKKIQGKRGVWYVAIQDNPADNVYFTKNDGKYSEGFAGRVLPFLLEDGTIDQIQGPWHSNSDSLYEDTGYDVRNKYLTQGIIAKRRKYDYFNGDRYTGVLHYDEEAVLGDYDRIENLAQEYANKLGVKVYYAVKTAGGGSSHMKEPQKET